MDASQRVGGGLAECNLEYLDTRVGTIESSEMRDKESDTALVNVHTSRSHNLDGTSAWTIRKMLAAAFLCMLCSGSQLTLYFVAGSFSFIAEDLQAQSLVGWLPVVNTVATASVAPFVGHLQDLLGRRHIALLGALILVIGSVIVGTTQNIAQIIAGMVVTGLGAGIGELASIAGIAEIVPVKQRGHSQAILIAFVLPFCPYIMYSQLFCTTGPHPTWRWGPWITLIYTFVTFIGLLLFYFPKSHGTIGNLSFSVVIKRVDFVGGCLSITGLTLLLVGLEAGGYTHPWESPYTLSLLIIGILFLVACGFWELKFAKHPMIPSGLFKGQRVVSLASTVTCIAGFNFFSLLNFWPITLSKVWASRPLSLGFRGLSVALTLTFGTVFWNILISTLRGRSKWILCLSSLMLTIFGGALASITPDNAPQSIALASFMGFGLGGVMLPATTVAILACPDELITTCVAFLLSVRTLGGAVGLSIYFHVYEMRLRSRLPINVAKYAIDAGLPAGNAANFLDLFLEEPEKAASLPGVTAAILAAATKGSQWAYAESLQVVWYISIPVGICAVCCSLALPDTRRYETNRIAVLL